MSGEFVGTAAKIKETVAKAVGRMFGTATITDTDTGTVEIAIADPQTGDAIRHEDIPMLVRRAPVPGDRVLYLNQVGGRVGLGVIGGITEEVADPTISAINDPDLDAGATSLPFIHTAIRQIYTWNGVSSRGSIVFGGRLVIELDWAGSGGDYGEDFHPARVDHDHASLRHLRRREFDVTDYGAIGDGLSHPLSEFYATLAEAQAVYPHAVALTDQIDWAATQAAVNAMLGTNSYGGGTLLFPNVGNIVGAAYLFNREVEVNKQGVQVEGVGGYGAELRPTADLTTTIFRFRVEGLIYRGAQMRNLVFNMTDSTASPFVMESPYDNVYLENVFCYGLSSPLTLKHNTSVATEQIGQTVTMINVYAYLKAGQTGEAIRLERIQEANLTGCKGGGGGLGSGTAIRLHDCASITLSGCSAAVALNGIHITSATRDVDSITIVGQLYENVTNRLVIEGTATWPCRQVTHLPARTETAGGPIILTHTSLCEIWSGIGQITLNATASQTVVHTRDASQVTDNGVNTTIYSEANAVVPVATANGVGHRYIGAGTTPGNVTGYEAVYTSDGTFRGYVALYDNFS